MSGKLNINPDALIDAGRALGVVKADFESLPQRADNTCGFISDATLSGKVAEFGSNWKKKREEMLTAIGGLGDAARGIGETIVDVDTQLESQLNGSATCANNGAV